MTYMEFKPGEKYPSKDADIADSPDSFRDCGYVMTDDDLVVDIDNLSHEAIKALITTFNIKTETVWTDRGVHFYFKRPNRFRRANLVCALGFPIEFKHTNNTKAVTVKRNGVLRKTDNQGVRETLPDFFFSQRKYENMLTLSDGEGRNNALYKHKMTLNNMTGWQSILKFINYHVFDEPLPIDELETLSREEVIPTGQKNGEYQVADYIIKKYNAVNYIDNLYLRIDEDGEYTNDKNVIDNIVYSVCGEVNTRYVDEVTNQVRRRGRYIPQDALFKIKFKNGYLKDGQFIELITDDFTPYHIEADYNPNAKPVKFVDDYINHLTNSDEDYKKLLFEILGHTLIVDPEFKRLLAKFFIFVGSGGNGKGTLLQIIKGILGAKNCTGLDIEQLSDATYLASFRGKLANLGDDVQARPINDKHMKILKNITTCDYVSSRELYKGSVDMYFTGTLIFTSNHLIKSFEKGESYKRRVLWLPMYTKVEEKDKDPLFITKLTSEESVEYWIKLIVEGYMRLYENSKFTNSEIVNEFNKDYHKENNPYLDYLQDTTPEDFIDHPVRDINQACEDWCKANDIEFKRNMFVSTLREMHNIDNNGTARKDGMMTKVYKKIKST